MNVENDSKRSNCNGFCGVCGLPASLQPGHFGNVSL